jgi:hypothetical protein
VQGLNQTLLNVSAAVRLVNTSNYEGLNLQRAATAHCQMGEVGVILDYDESFGYSVDLANIELQMRNPNIYAAFLSVKYKSILFKMRFEKGNTQHNSK